MASRYPSGPFLLDVIFEARADGGLIARCEKVPEFYLSHSNPELVREDVAPALETILSAMFGLPMTVKRLRDLDEALHQQLSFPPHLCAKTSYVGLTEAN